MSSTSADMTQRVHSDALNYSRAEEASGHEDALDGKIYKLLLKNVTRSDPLSTEEAQVCVDVEYCGGNV